MPAIRGIKIDIISQWDLRVHPEFPHPDSFKSEAFNNSEDGQQSFNGSPSSTSKYNFTEQEDSVSVYTPSVPGKSLDTDHTINCNIARRQILDHMVDYRSSCRRIPVVLFQALSQR